ncbi:MAG: winged helix DNA-binding domain-containing protein [Chloroflexota bacterium]|nr:winged helix DNA-binding domain-containing protein [Chloroflexota bacterium]
MLDVASRLCGLHAQVLSSADLTLQARIDDLPRDAVSKALWQDRELVKVWAMRGTLHLFAAREYPIWQAALSTLKWLTPAWLRWYDITERDLFALFETIAEVLDGRLLTRQELADAVARKMNSPAMGEKIRRSSWGSMLKPPTRMGYVCFAPSVGQNVRFTRPSSWLKDWQPVDPQWARAEVTRRFLHVYGPATPAEFERWLGGAMTGKRLLQGIDDEVTTAELDGKKVYLLKTDLADMQSAEPQGSVRLLPAFDQYVVGAPREDSPVLPIALKPRVYRNQGWFTPVLLVDGRMRGVWRHTRTGSRLKIWVEAFGDLEPWVVRRAEEEAERLAQYLGGSLEVCWQPLPPTRQVQGEGEVQEAAER